MVIYFPQLSVDVAVGGLRHKGLVLSKRLGAGRRALCLLSHLPAFHRWLRTAIIMVASLAPHGVVWAPVLDGNRTKLDPYAPRSPFLYHDFV